MKSESEVLKQFEKYPPNEQAAALSHWMYVQTSLHGESKWPLRVSERWDVMEPRAKEFNIAIIDTWARHPQLFEAFVNAVTTHRSHMAQSRSPGDKSS